MNIKFNIQDYWLQKMTIQERIEVMAKVPTVKNESTITRLRKLHNYVLENSKSEVENWITEQESK